MTYPDVSGKPDTDPKAPVMHSRIALGDQALLMVRIPTKKIIHSEVSAIKIDAVGTG